MYHANQAYYNGQDSNYEEGNAGMAWSQNNATTEGFNFNRFLQDQQHLLFPATGLLPAGNTYLPFQGEPHYLEEVEEDENEATDYEDLQPEQEQWHHPEGPHSRNASLGFNGAVSRETYNAQSFNSNNQRVETPHNDEYEPENPMITQVLRKPERQHKQTSTVDKAAELRAKVLASRTHKQGTPNRDKKQELGQKDKAPEAGEAPTAVPATRTHSVTDLDGLIAEERAAAETKAQQDGAFQAMSSGPTRSVAEPATSFAEEAHQRDLAAALNGHAGTERASGSQLNAASHETTSPTPQETIEALRRDHDAHAQVSLRATTDPSSNGSAGGNCSEILSSHKDRPLAARRQEKVADGHPQLRSGLETQK
ncbi:hypothetical protein W97_08356 [Coniosporium apollinis CBS 100218]|uniref:Uncharacterized protein n=1 Tax=Coniosporium apollinis (strain CBS 100218) TaxID=1168221 RepID=R7Z4L1_CONA1|nr:uncharacterized protein W97_08356 [Coniosporium apollinis CBS 100218]EON69043.1 hypothetical protein W97_08356 [Coniosporium apollinis CBS 100218]